MLLSSRFADQQTEAQRLNRLIKDFKLLTVSARTDPGSLLCVDGFPLLWERGSWRLVSVTASSLGRVLLLLPLPLWTVGGRVQGLLHPWASLVAQLVRLRLPRSRPWPDSWVGKTRWRRDRPPAPVFSGSPVAQRAKNPPHCRRPQFNPWVGEIPWRRNRLPTPVFWPGEVTDCMGSQRVGHE